MANTNKGKLEGTGSENVAIGNQAGYICEGSGNVFIGFKAGEAETESNTLYIANSGTTEPLIYGKFSGRELRFYTDQSWGFTA